MNFIILYNFNLGIFFEPSRIFLILPDTGFNVMGTIWAFSDVVKCVNLNDNFANTSIEGKRIEIPEL